MSNRKFGCGGFIFVLRGSQGEKPAQDLAISQLEAMRCTYLFNREAGGETLRKRIR